MLETKTTVQWDYSLDVIRCAAILCVIGVHSFSTMRDYWFVLSVLRTLSVLGVPLFLLLTGFLNSNKTIADYYQRGTWKKIVPNYIAYVVLGSICFFAPKILFDDGFTICAWIKSVLNFTCTPYGWYMNMWIGLFFLTPFLNVILQQIGKKEEVTLIITLLVLSQFASFINRNENVFLHHFSKTFGLYPFTLRDILFPNTNHLYMLKF